MAADKNALGRIDEFDSKAEEWSQYQMHLKCYLQANGVTDATTKKSILITVVGRENFKLLRKDVDWKWEEEEKAAFQASKELILSSELLVHFDPKLPIIATGV